MKNELLILFHSRLQYNMKKPDGIKFHRRNSVRPFEDQSSIEFFSNKNDCSLMAYGSHQKKRPHNLVLGRFFDHQVLDLIELGVEHFKSAQDFDVSAPPSAGCLCHYGDGRNPQVR